MKPKQSKYLIQTTICCSRLHVGTQSALELGPSHCRNGRLGQDLGFGRFAFALKLPKLSSPLIGLAKRPPFISINLCCLGRNRPEGHSKSTRGPYAASGLDLTAQMKRYGDVGLSVNMGQHV